MTTTVAAEEYDCVNCTSLSKKLKCAREWNVFYHEKLGQKEKFMQMALDYDRVKQHIVEYQLAYDQQTREANYLREQMTNLLLEVEPLKDSKRSAEEQHKQEQLKREAAESQLTGLTFTVEQLSHQVKLLKEKSQNNLVETLEKKLTSARNLIRRLKITIEDKTRVIEALKQYQEDRRKLFVRINKKAFWALKLAKDLSKLFPEDLFNEEILTALKRLTNVYEVTERSVNAHYSRFINEEEQKFKKNIVELAALPSLQDWLNDFDSHLQEELMFDDSFDEYSSKLPENEGKKLEMLLQDDNSEMFKTEKVSPLPMAVESHTLERLPCTNKEPVPSPNTMKDAAPLAPFQKLMSRKSPKCEVDQESSSSKDKLHIQKCGNKVDIQKCSRSSAESEKTRSLFDSDNEEPLPLTTFPKADKASQQEASSLPTQERTCVRKSSKIETIDDSEKLSVESGKSTLPSTSRQSESILTPCINKVPSQYGTSDNMPVDDIIAFIMEDMRPRAKLDCLDSSFGNMDSDMVAAVARELDENVFGESVENSDKLNSSQEVNFFNEYISPVEKPKILLSQSSEGFSTQGIGDDLCSLPFTESLVSDGESVSVERNKTYTCGTLSSSLVDNKQESQELSPSQISTSKVQVDRNSDSKVVGEVNSNHNCDGKVVGEANSSFTKLKLSNLRKQKGIISESCEKETVSSDSGCINKGILQKEVESFEGKGNESDSKKSRIENPVTNGTLESTKDALKCHNKIYPEDLFGLMTDSDDENMSTHSALKKVDYMSNQGQYSASTTLYVRDQHVAKKRYTRASKSVKLCDENADQVDGVNTNTANNKRCETNLATLEKDKASRADMYSEGNEGSLADTHILSRCEGKPAPVSTSQDSNVEMECETVETESGKWNAARKLAPSDEKTVKVMSEPHNNLKLLAAVQENKQELDGYETVKSISNCGSDVESILGGGLSVSNEDKCAEADLLDLSLSSSSSGILALNEDNSDSRRSSSMTHNQQTYERPECTSMPNVLSVSNEDKFSEVDLLDLSLSSSSSGLLAVNEVNSDSRRSSSITHNQQTYERSEYTSMPNEKANMKYDSNAECKGHADVNSYLNDRNDELGNITEIHSVTEKVKVADECREQCLSKGDSVPVHKQETMSGHLHAQKDADVNNVIQEMEISFHSSQGVNDQKNKHKLKKKTKKNSATRKLHQTSKTLKEDTLEIGLEELQPRIAKIKDEYQKVLSFNRRGKVTGPTIVTLSKCSNRESGEADDIVKTSQVQTTAASIEQSRTDSCFLTQSRLDDEYSDGDNDKLIETGISSETALINDIEGIFGIISDSEDESTSILPTAKKQKMCDDVLISDYHADDGKKEQVEVFEKSIAKPVNKYFIDCESTTTVVQEMDSKSKPSPIVCDATPLNYCAIPEKIVAAVEASTMKNSSKKISGDETNQPVKSDIQDDYLKNPAENAVMQGIMTRSKERIRKSSETSITRQLSESEDSRDFTAGKKMLDAGPASPVRSSSRISARLAKKVTGQNVYKNVTPAEGTFKSNCDESSSGKDRNHMFEHDSDELNTSTESVCDPYCSGGKTRVRRRSSTRLAVAEKRRKNYHEKIAGLFKSKKKKKEVLDDNIIRSSDRLENTVMDKNKLFSQNSHSTLPLCDTNQPVHPEAHTRKDVRSKFKITFKWGARLPATFASETRFLKKSVIDKCIPDTYGSWHHSLFSLENRKKRKRKFVRDLESSSNVQHLSQLCREPHSFVNKDVVNCDKRQPHALEKKVLISREIDVAKAPVLLKKAEAVDGFVDKESKKSKKQQPEKEHDIYGRLFGTESSFVEEETSDYERKMKLDRRKRTKRNTLRTKRESILSEDYVYSSDESEHSLPVKRKNKYGVHSIRSDSSSSDINIKKEKGPTRDSSMNRSKNKNTGENIGQLDSESEFDSDQVDLALTSKVKGFKRHMRLLSSSELVESQSKNDCLNMLSEKEKEVSINPSMKKEAKKENTGCKRYKSQLVNKAMKISKKSYLPISAQPQYQHLKNTSENVRLGNLADGVTCAQRNISDVSPSRKHFESVPGRNTCKFLSPVKDVSEIASRLSMNYKHIQEKKRTIILLDSKPNCVSKQLRKNDDTEFISHNGKNRFFDKIPPDSLVKKQIKSYSLAECDTPNPENSVSCCDKSAATTSEPLTDRWKNEKSLDDLEEELSTSDDDRSMQICESSEDEDDKMSAVTHEIDASSSNNLLKKDVDIPSHIPHPGLLSSLAQLGTLTRPRSKPKPLAPQKPSLRVPVPASSAFVDKLFKQKNSSKNKAAKNATVKTENVDSTCSFSKSPEHIVSSAKENALTAVIPQNAFSISVNLVNSPKNHSMTVDSGVANFYRNMEDVAQHVNSGNHSVQETKWDKEQTGKITLEKSDKNLISSQSQVEDSRFSQTEHLQPVGSILDTHQNTVSVPKNVVLLGEERQERGEYYTEILEEIMESGIGSQIWNSCINKLCSCPSAVTNLSCVARIFVKCIMKADTQEKNSREEGLLPSLYRLYQCLCVFEKRKGLPAGLLRNLVARSIHKLVVTNHRIRPNSLANLTAWFTAGFMLHEFQEKYGLEHVRVLLIDLLYHHPGTVHQALLSAVTTSKRIMLRYFAERNITCLEKLIHWVVWHGRWVGCKAVRAELQEWFLKFGSSRNAPAKDPMDLSRELLKELAGCTDEGDCHKIIISIVILAKWQQHSWIQDKLIPEVKKTYAESGSSELKASFKLLMDHLLASLQKPSSVNQSGEDKDP